MKYLYLLLIVVITGCGSDSEDSTPLTEVEIPIGEVAATYTPPSLTQITVGKAHTFNSAVVWNNANEVTQEVTWTGNGAVYLDNLSQLNPIFSASEVGTYELTQTIVSNLLRSVSASITVKVEALVAPTFIPPENITVGLQQKYTLVSAITWANNNETIQSVLWSGNGAMLLNDTSLLNPVFNGEEVGEYQLTQTIKSSLDYIVETHIVISVKEQQFSQIKGISISIGTTHNFSSMIEWNNQSEVTESIVWSGEGAVHLNAKDILNPTFSAAAIGIFPLTQNISSSYGNQLVSKINVVVYNEDIQAVRFLQQATFGPSLASIAEVKASGYEKWIDDQIAMPASRHMDILVHKRDPKWRWQAWSDKSTYAPDQLKQRMGFALSEIMTVSFKANAILYNQQAGMTDYYDKLVANSLGSFRELLEVVTRHPVMGIYLTYIGNKPGSRPDENFAREIMQLFTIGLVELNMDGSFKVDDAGNTIPTYSQNTVEQLAKVFTGLCFPRPKTKRYCSRYPENGTFSLPMVYWDEAHDKDEKRLLNDVVLSANQNGDKDLNDALDNLAFHPNTAPFISSLLIKRLVTSNPTPAYVKRVATVFEKYRGDLKEVAKAILLDKEAQLGQHSNSFGKLREPLLKMTHLFRALDAHMPNIDQYRFGRGLNFYHIFGQAPFYSPSVFNFFAPDYTQGTLKKHSLVGPEFQILTTSQMLKTENKFFELISFPAVHYPNIHLNILQNIYEQQGVEALLEKLNILFTSGLMTESMKTTIRNQIVHMKAKNDDATLITKNVLLFTMQSPEFAIQR